MITLSIDVTLLDKARFKKVKRKNGKEAVFADLVLFEAASQYGDWIVKQQCSKEERAAKTEMPILGNGKNWQSGVSERDRPAASSKAEKPETEEEDVPF